MDSGNGYKVRLLLSQLGTPFELIERDILAGETRTPEFLAKNPNGKIPVLEFEDGTCLAESNAIIWYLADGTKFLPDDKLLRAQVMQWMCFEQYSHEPNIATARFWIKHFELDDAKKVMLPLKKEAGAAALGVMERHLSERRWFVGGAYSIADICLYGYTHVAGEGPFDLAPFTAVRAWLARVAAQPGHVTIDHR
jgi:glutathione S-transferase